jgi:hypothetical protein
MVKRQAKGQASISDIGLKDLAEGHLKRAVDRLGKLVEHQDARIALEASQLIVRLARPRFPGWPGGGGWGGPWGGGPWGPVDPWGDWGGVRAG